MGCLPAGPEVRVFFGCSRGVGMIRSPSLEDLVPGAGFPKRMGVKGPLILFLFS
jgi:hypothetical protein